MLLIALNRSLNEPLTQCTSIGKIEPDELLANEIVNLAPDLPSNPRTAFGRLAEEAKSYSKAALSKDPRCVPGWTNP